MASSSMVINELKIANWVKFMRITEHALTRLLTKTELNKIKNEAEFKVIAFDDNNKDIVVVNDTGLGHFIDRATLLVTNISKHALSDFDNQ